MDSVAPSFQMPIRHKVGLFAIRAIRHDASSHAMARDKYCLTVPVLCERVMRSLIPEYFIPCLQESDPYKVPMSCLTALRGPSSFTDGFLSS